MAASKCLCYVGILPTTSKLYHHSQQDSYQIRRFCLITITTICTISFIQMFYIFRGIYPEGVGRWPFGRTSSTSFVIGHLKSSITYMFAVSHGIQGHKSVTADIKILSHGIREFHYIQLYYNLKIICTRSQRSLHDVSYLRLGIVFPYFCASTIIPAARYYNK